MTTNLLIQACQMLHSMALGEKLFEESDNIRGLKITSSSNWGSNNRR